MTDLAVYLVAVLAIYRLTHALTLEDGPFDLFARWREWVGQGSWVGRGWHCTLCLSFWWSMPLGLFPPFGFVIGWLGGAGLMLVIHRLLYRDCP